MKTYNGIVLLRNSLVNNHERDRKDLAADHCKKNENIAVEKEESQILQRSRWNLAV